MIRRTVLTEGTQGAWVWLADHDLDSGGSQQTTIFSGRGILSESAGPVWLIGTGCKSFTVYLRLKLAD